jgi:hypothetical protein
MALFAHIGGGNSQNPCKIPCIFPDKQGICPETSWMLTAPTTTLFVHLVNSRSRLRNAAVLRRFKKAEV